MTSQVRGFVTRIKEKIGKQERVLEVGSRGDTQIRELFTDADEFIGIDLQPGGPEVNMVLNGHNLLEKFELESFDCVISTETLEHDDKFWLTVENMRKVLKPNGWMILTAPGPGCPPHLHPSDYYRFYATAFRDVLFEGFIETEFIEICYRDQPTNQPDAVFGVGRKPEKHD